MAKWREHQVVYLEPACEKCITNIEHNNDTGRSWCQDPQEACPECGKPWVKFALVPDSGYLREAN